MLRLSLAFTLFAALFAWPLSSSLAADPQPLCSSDAATTSLGTATPVTKGAEALEGRLGGSRDDFDERFGEPASEVMWITYQLEGCGEVYVGFEADVVTDVGIYWPGDVDDEAGWTIDEALRIADRVLPLDVEMEDPYRNVAFTERYECFSEALAEEVPESVYASVDDDLTPGQCSVMLQLEDDDVVAIVVQLLVEDVS